jgi:hypothetical protein
VKDDPMAAPLGELVKCWIAWGGINPRFTGDLAWLDTGFAARTDVCRPGADPRAVTDWEVRHGYKLPPGLRAWLMLSNGLFGTGPIIHPISAIGPMVPFARFPDLIVQPESWFELGNPNLQTVCIDLAYRLPDGGCPIFTSGDDAAHSPPRIIARGFEEWFLELLKHGGREYWFDPGFADFGDPWPSHRLYAANPRLSRKLRPYRDRVASLLRSGADERDIAANLGLTTPDVELICRHLQHVSPERVQARSLGT